MTSSIIPLIRVVPEEEVWINRFNNDLWLFYDPFFDKYYSYSLSINNCNELWNSKYKEWILSAVGNGFIGGNGAIHLKYNTLQSITSDLKKICRWGSQFYPEQDLKVLSEVEIHELITYIFCSPIGVTKSQAVLSFKSVEQFIAILSKISKAFLDGKVSDGVSELSFLPLNYRGGVHPFFKHLAKKNNIDLHEWVKGGSFGKVPVHIAMAFLGHSIETIRSRNTKFAAQIYRWYANVDKLGKEEVVANLARLHKIFSYINAYIEIKKTGVLSLRMVNKSGNNSEKEVAISQRKDEYIQARYHGNKTHEEALLKLPNSTGFRSGASQVWRYEFDEYLVVHKYLEESYALGDIPFTNREQLSSFVCKKLRSSTLVILLCLTGARSWSEIAQMTFGDIEYEFGLTRYSTPITKTNHGIKAARKSTHLIYEAVMVLNCFCVEGLGEEVNKMRPVFSSKTGKFISVDYHNIPMAGRQLMSLLTGFYDSFVSQYPEFKDEHGTISSHQFRHTWAEFALRRFEGDIPEIIRRQFMHSFGSGFTNDYTFSKLEPETRDMLVRGYLKETLHKIGSGYINNITLEDFETEFQGKAIKLLNRSLETKVFSLEDVEVWAEEEADNYYQIQAHEYGYCLLRKELVEHAKCYDETTGIAIVGAAKFTDCANCCNFAAHKGNNLANIKRQAIGHQSTIDRLKKQYPHFTDEQPLIKASKFAVEQASQIIGQWKL
jgi:integrase